MSPELIDATINTWQRYYSVPLTREDAVQMIMGVAALTMAFAGESQR